MTVRPLYIAIIIFTTVLCITQIAALQIFHSEKDKEQLAVEREAMHIKHRLDNVFGVGKYATKSLAFLVEQKLLDEQFDEFAQDVLKRTTFIDALQLVKDDAIIKTYPLTGNEASIGYAIMKVPEHKAAALKALERNDLYFEGPLELKQGGSGIVGRYPIFENDEYWGFAAVIIRVRTLMSAMGLDSLGENEFFLYQLVKKQEDSFTKIILFNKIDNYDKGVFHETFVTAGDWSVFVKLKHSYYLPIALFVSIIGLILSMFLAYTGWVLANQPYTLRQLVKEQTKEIENKNKDLETLSKELINANKELKQFAFITSHDLQEPLRMIDGFLKQLERKYGHQLDERAHQYIHFATDGAKNMRQIILDLMKYSQITKEGKSSEKVDINKIIDEFCQFNHAIISKANAKIQYNKLPVISSYKSLIRQVFYPILDNALKYRRKNVLPLVRVSHERNNGVWTFIIEDNGIGIESEYYEKVFMIFEKLHDKKDYEGSGIGLAIVKKVIEQMNGQIWIEPNKESGSRFIFNLPVS